MAGANLPAQKYKHSSPTVTRLSFEFTGNSTQFIDIAMALSIINRQGLRQGLYYYVNSVEVYNNSVGVLDLHTIPDNWITKNAHQRGFQLFQKMNALVDTPISGIGRPAYHDFKVYMNVLHSNTGSKNPSLHDINASALEVLADDWVYSQYTSADDDGDPIQDADEFTAHMIGAHAGTSANWTSIGLIKSYAETRATVQTTAPEDANIVLDDPLANLFDFSSEEQINDIMENLLSDNDAPPYNYNNYVGEQTACMQHVARLGTEAGAGRVARAAGFCAPFGLICVDAHGLPSGDNFRVVLNLAVGSYHGVYAERS